MLHYNFGTYDSALPLILLCSLNQERLRKHTGKLLSVSTMPTADHLKCT